MTEMVGKKPRKKKTSKNALNETSSTIKSNSSSCYSIWNTLTKTLTGNKRLHQYEASDLLNNSRPSSQPDSYTEKSLYEQSEQRKRAKDDSRREEIPRSTAILD